MRGIWAVLLVLVVAGCGGGADPPAPKAETCGADNHPDGARLVFTAAALDGGAPPLAEALDLTRRQLCARLAAEDVTGNVTRSGADQLVVTLPSGADADALGEALAQPGRLQFIDWEANLLDTSACKTHPTVVASEFDTNSRRAVELAAEMCGRATVQFVRVAATETVAKPDRWFLLRDAPALTGEDIEDPEANFDAQTDEPIITMDLTAAGRRKFAAMTKAIAHRGQDSAPPGQDPAQSSQHFGIVLDDQLLSLPYIDWRENPDGIDGSTGLQITGGYTVASARALASLLNGGALPVRLTLIER